MAKELPYFKFEPSQYDNGNIQLCSFEAQGVFINVCSMYWQRLGDLPYKLAVQKICNGNATALESLSAEHVIKVIDGMICIDFLNEQLSEFENTSKVNSKNAMDGWVKRRNQTNKPGKNATALPAQSERNAIREEKRREEERREDKIPFVGDELKSWNEWVQFRKELGKKITPSTEKKQIQFLGGRAGPEISAIINQSITNGWTGLFDLKKQTNGIRHTNEGTAIATTSIIEPGKDFGIEKGFSRSGSHGGGNGGGSKTGA